MACRDRKISDTCRKGYSCPVGEKNLYFSYMKKNRHCWTSSEFTKAILSFWDEFPSDLCILVMVSHLVLLLIILMLRAPYSSKFWNRPICYQTSSCLFISLNEGIWCSWYFTICSGWKIWIANNYWPLKRQTKIAADNILIFYFHLSKKIRLDFSCESSA